jgi:hypothetical protein
MRAKELVALSAPVVVGGGVASLLLMFLNRTYRPVSEVKAYVDEISTSADGIAANLDLSQGLEALERTTHAFREKAAIGSVRVLPEAT